MVFVVDVKADAFTVVWRGVWVVFSVLLYNDLVVLFEFAADTLLKFNIKVKPNNNRSIINSFCLIL